MAILVETGAGLSGANSYASVANLRAYATGRGRTLPDDDLKCETLLIRAMDRLKGLRYQGFRATQAQALDFPRHGVYIDGYTLVSTQIPKQLIEAQCAFAIAAQTMELLPTTPGNTAGPKVRQTIGPITTEYANVGATRRTPIVTEAEEPLALILQPRGAIGIRS